MLLAAGHHRHGVLLAPLTAQLVADHLEHGLVDPALDPRRFAAHDHPTPVEPSPVETSPSEGSIRVTSSVTITCNGERLALPATDPALTVADLLALRRGIRAPTASPWPWTTRWCRAPTGRATGSPTAPWSRS